MFAMRWLCWVSCLLYGLAAAQISYYEVDMPCAGSPPTLEVIIPGSAQRLVLEIPVGYDVQPGSTLAFAVDGGQVAHTTIVPPNKETVEQNGGAGDSCGESNDETVEQDGSAGDGSGESNGKLLELNWIPRSPRPWRLDYCPASLPAWAESLLTEESDRPDSEYESAADARQRCVQQQSSANASSSVPHVAPTYNEPAVAIDRVNGEALSAADFFQRYVQQALPLVLTGGPGNSTRSRARWERRRRAVLRARRDRLSEPEQSALFDGCRAPHGCEIGRAHV